MPVSCFGPAQFFDGLGDEVLGVLQFQSGALAMAVSGVGQFGQVQGILRLLQGFDGFFDFKSRWHKGVWFFVV